jgi:hypothetical protein
VLAALVSFSSAENLNRIYRAYVPAEDTYIFTSGASQISATKAPTIEQYKPRRIIDADGDGVEDNVKLDQYNLDRFRKMVYSPAVEDIHNTRNGELPGHHRWGDHPEPGTNPHAVQDAKDAKKKADAIEKDKKDVEALKGQYVMTRNEELLQTAFAANANKIYDADGDGVEDNIDFSSEQLDDFYFPTNFNSAEDIYNTRHGGMPGHRQREFYEAQYEPASMELVRGPW